MKKIKIVSRTILYLLVAFVSFLMLVNAVQFPDFSKNINVEQQVEKIEEHREESVLNSMIEHDVPIVSIGEWKKKFVFLEYISKENSQVLPMIYLFIMATFLIQSVLLALSNYYKELVAYSTEKTIDNLFIYISEWTINAPPVLGVVGTIFSFGIVVSNMSDMSGLTTLFKENFADAALTTILGGIVYVLNLLLTLIHTINNLILFLFLYTLVL